MYNFNKEENTIKIIATNDNYITSINFETVEH